DVGRGPAGVGADVTRAAVSVGCGGDELLLGADGDRAVCRRHGQAGQRGGRQAEDRVTTLVAAAASGQYGADEDGEKPDQWLRNTLSVHFVLGNCAVPSDFGLTVCCCGVPLSVISFWHSAGYRT